MGLELATQWLQGKLLHPLLPNVCNSLRLRGSSRQAGRIQLWTQMFLLTYLTFPCANVVESHGSLPRSDGNPVAPIAVSHHVEPGQTDPNIHDQIRTRTSQKQDLLQAHPVGADL